jgi:hypothetical protein
MFGLQVDSRVLIESPTVYWLGEVEEIGPTGLVLKPGAFEIRFIQNLYRLLHKGTWHESDEATPLPGRARVPMLSVVVAHEFPHPLPKPNRTAAQMLGD